MQPLPSHRYSNLGHLLSFRSASILTVIANISLKQKHKTRPVQGNVHPWSRLIVALSLFASAPPVSFYENMFVEIPQYLWDASEDFHLLGYKAVSYPTCRRNKSTTYSGFLAGFFRHWRWRRHVPPKPTTRRYIPELFILILAGSEVLPTLQFTNVSEKRTTSIFRIKYMLTMWRARNKQKVRNYWLFGLRSRH
jgi:hypothetical protein